ncbi:MAG: radical SAM protein [Myxococcota bacterium]
MPKSLYLINPREDLPTYFGSDISGVLGLPSFAEVGDLSTTTVAALAPDDFEIRICDEAVAPVDFDCGAEIVGITGKVSQSGRMMAIADEFRRRGTTVLMGGSFTSLSPEVVAPHADVLVCGEIEEIADDLFSDLRSGCFKDRYTGTRPPLDSSPVPRWDLYPNHAAISGCVQTSRGCPFECEFCDVIQFVGRVQRHKPIATVLQELEVLHRAGYRAVFIADDNFTVYRRRTKQLLRAMRDWNRRQKGQMAFSTQLSIDAAEDEELIRLLGEAGFSTIFIGIETPNEDSLRETKKRQNVGIDIVERIRRFYDAGIIVNGGMIVGFDNDGGDIFRRQYEFLMEAAIPFATLAVLVAPATTPLYDRLEKEGRLVVDAELAGNPLSTNIVPLKMTREELTHGTRWLASKLYSPQAFAERIVRFIDQLGPQRSRPLTLGHIVHHAGRRVDRTVVRVAMSVGRMGREEAKMVARIVGAVARKPAAARFVVGALFRYRQIRYLYDAGKIWDPQLAQAYDPGISTPVASPTQPAALSYGLSGSS